MHHRVPRAFTIAGLCCVVLGLALATTAGVLVKQTRDLKDRFQRGPGTVVSVHVEKNRERSPGSDGDVLSRDYWPTVRYTPEGGKPLKVRTATYSSLPPKVGEKVEVRYDPEDPKTIYIGGQAAGVSAYVRAGFFGLGSAAAFCGALVGLLLGFFLRRSPHWVRTNGTPMSATVTKVEPVADTSGPFPPWIITATGQDPTSFEQRTFRSDRVTYDPRPFFAPGQSITVRVDPKHPDKYWVDTTPPQPSLTR